MAGVLEFTDDLFLNTDVYIMTYKGEEPFKIRRFIVPLFKDMMEISGSKVYPLYLGWDMTDGTYKAKWMADKKLDNWSKLRLQIWCWGEADTGRANWMKAKVVGHLCTKYTYANSIQKSMWYTYSYIFYDKQRAKYANEGRRLMVAIWREIQKKYGMRT
ncbi:MAG: hypothetical protein KAR87_05490 [Candidatus Aenigmarchaeota archaeon]|nr:hypothetical protein [Candidatus Aenigmarchaeota archaeon]